MSLRQQEHHRACYRLAVPAVLDFEISSQLRASRADVWAAVSSMEGVNYELMPFVRMTYPARASRLTAADIKPGELLFQSWLLAFGAVPFDLHALVLMEVTDGEGFVEESSSWMQRRWRHERRLRDAVSGCVVTDHLVVEPRLRMTQPVVGAAVRRLFSHRHRRLRRRFGAG